MSGVVGSGVGQVDRVGYAPSGTENLKCHVSRSLLCSTPLDGETVRGRDRRTQWPAPAEQIGMDGAGSLA